LLLCKNLLCNEKPAKEKFLKMLMAADDSNHPIFGVNMSAKKLQNPLLVQPVGTWLDMLRTIIYGNVISTVLKSQLCAIKTLPD